MGAQKPGFCEDIRCDVQIRGKTRFLSSERVIHVDDYL
jgi:hypothetical protein